MASDKTNEIHDSNTKKYVPTEEDNGETHRLNAASNPVQIDNEAPEAGRAPKKKITIVVDEDDPCLKPVEEEKQDKTEYHFIGADPRFQQQNQTLRCWVMYTDFFRCERILGEGASQCTWFKQAFTTICPSEWVHRWDDLRVEGKFPWHKYKTQGEFPGDKYGV